MKTTVWIKRSGIAAALAIAVLSSVSRGDEVVHYGRAGGAVGADRIKELRSVQRVDPNTQPQSPVVERYGRAGGPVGVNVVAAGEHKAYAARSTEPVRIPKVYGRAGVPLPFQN
jgi:hypothetical protein